MPVVFQQTILRSDLHANRDYLYLFGDNEERRGLGGQAEQMRGEPNAHGIRTKKAPSMEAWALWTDEDYDRVVELIREDFEKPYRWITAGKVIVIPAVRFGTQRADLHINAPRVLAFINEKVDLLVAIGAEIIKDQNTTPD